MLLILMELCATIPLAWRPCLSSSKHHAVCMGKGRLDLIVSVFRVVSTMLYARGKRRLDLIVSVFRVVSTMQYVWGKAGLI